MDKIIGISELAQYRSQNKKFAAVACYDYTTARLLSQTDIEIALVGDSAAEFVLGFKNTLGATMDFMVAITAAVRRGAPNVFVVADMPFLSYHVSIADAVKNAGRFIVEAGADIVKFEASDKDLHIIESVANANIPVMAHIGIRPQTAAMGKLKAAGTDEANAKRLEETAKRMVEAGAKMLLLEGVAGQTAAHITQNSPVPVIGCGSGPDCDGQVLVAPDILGLLPGSAMPKFSMSFGQAGQVMLDALDAYSREVHAGTFPDDAHTYHFKGQH